MNIEREFIERRRENRRRMIQAGIRAIHERRASSFQDEGLRSEHERRVDNFAVFDWIARFENARKGI